MNRIRTSVRAVLALAALLAGAGATADVVTPQREFVGDAVAFLQVVTPASANLERGTAVVARDGRLVYTAAHLLFENARWATTFRVVPGWNAETTPDPTAGVVPRGFRHYAGYADAAAAHGGNAPETFDLDFAVMYAFTRFGTPVATLTDAGATLRDGSVPKRIAGYPVFLDVDGVTQGFAFQHATPLFDTAAVQSFGAYHVFQGVSTGPGNSGGPLFVQDAQGGQALAGLLLSGTQSTAGVYALDGAADALAADTLGDATVVATRAFANKAALRLPDNDPTYRERTVSVSGFTGALRSLVVGLLIDTPRRGDLDVYLVSPAGRTQWIARHQAGASGALRFTNTIYTARYAGQAGNGKWRLRMRDVARGNTATFRALTLTVSAPVN